MLTNGDKVTVLGGVIEQVCEAAIHGGVTKISYEIKTNVVLFVDKDGGEHFLTIHVPQEAVQLAP